LGFLGLTDGQAFAGGHDAFSRLFTPFLAYLGGGVVPRWFALIAVLSK
jgi:hypothetical protein